MFGTEMFQMFVQKETGKETWSLRESGVDLREVPGRAAEDQIVVRNPQMQDLHVFQGVTWIQSRCQNDSRIVAKTEKEVLIGKLAPSRLVGDGLRGTETEMWIEMRNRQTK